MALMAGIAVMMCPSTMKSASVSAWKSGGGRNWTVERMVRTSLHLDDVTVLDLPIGLERRRLLPSDVQLDHGPVAHFALPAGGDTGHAPRRDLPRTEIEVRRRLGMLGVHTMSSSSTPSASATIATASLNTAVPSAVMAWRLGSSIGRPNPAGFSVAGES
jgi:hypothetical protein